MTDNSSVDHNNMIGWTTEKISDFRIIIKNRVNELLTENWWFADESFRIGEMLFSQALSKTDKTKVNRFFDNLV